MPSRWAALFPGMISTMASTDRTKKTPRRYTLAAVAFWIILWQLGAMALGHELLLPSPAAVAGALARLLGQRVFWQSIAASCSRILLGLVLGCAVGIGLAGAASAFVPVRVLADTLTTVLRTTPVASFIILALLWVPSRNLSVLISFVMVAPVLYANTLAGLNARDAQLAEMAALFKVSRGKRLRYVTAPQLAPWVAGGCRMAVGLAFKSGVAAEVIGLPGATIGERLYQAKLYLETGELFAWTLVIIALCAVSEKLVGWLLDLLQRRLAK